MLAARHDDDDTSTSPSLFVQRFDICDSSHITLESVTSIGPQYEKFTNNVHLECAVRTINIAALWRTEKEQASTLTRSTKIHSVGQLIHSEECYQCKKKSIRCILPNI